MRLSTFILDNMQTILEEWEAFATTLVPAAASMTPLALRNDAQNILEAVAEDLTTVQTRDEQSEKSKGRAPQVVDAPETAAQTHAVLRARSGFNINQLVAEYRALRASVLRLWIDAGPIDELGMEDMIRFNEAIDQAIAESVGHFHGQMERARNLFLGMLGHDMRTPLNSIVSTASYLAALNAGDRVSVAADRLIRSGVSMRALLDDLVDFNRTQLGLGIKVLPLDVDLAPQLEDEVEQLRGAYPAHRIELAVNGDTHGQWDAGRLMQLVRNLVSNAVGHGTREAPVRVAFIGEGDAARLEVSNQGLAIEASVRSRMFDPLQRGLGVTADETRAGNLGLGLFIVHEIAKAHGAEVDVVSEDGETTFVVRLPRRNPGPERL